MWCFPSLVSSGYSTCHWCHVMAAGAFSDPETADFLNRNFVCIKIDREQRPDIDQFLMHFCQEQNGRDRKEAARGNQRQMVPHHGRAYKIPPDL